jgi:glycosyltransferase-like protein
MSAARSLRVALLTHSTNPRGGVVHTLELADALTRLGHRVTVFAPDATGGGFFRPALCETRCIPVAPAEADVLAMVEQRVADYLRYFARADCDDFDVWHAQDGISGNSLATLKADGRIAGFCRTVHHVDNFADARLGVLQHRAIDAADRLFVVSALWRDWLRREYRREAAIGGNGVNTVRFSPRPDASDAILWEHLDFVPGAPIFLTVGGVETRKNTLRILEAFKQLHARQAGARLVIAGGASLLDHSAYQMQFAEALAASGLPASAVICTGPLPQELMPPLYRAATALVFSSVKEGFGLVVLEAMASGTPAIVSRIAPFTEYLESDDVLWCDPAEPRSIATAMKAVLHPAVAAQLRERGFARAAAFDWRRVAQAHHAEYALSKEPCDA